MREGAAAARAWGEQEVRRGQQEVSQKGVTPNAMATEDAGHHLALDTASEYAWKKPKDDRVLRGQRGIKRDSGSIDDAVKASLVYARDKKRHC